MYNVDPWLPTTSLYSQSWTSDPAPPGMDIASQSIGDMVEGHGDYVPNLHDTPSASWTELISQIDGKLPEIETSECCCKCADLCAFSMCKALKYCNAAHL